jgi:hypothetical protein
MFVDRFDVIESCRRHRQREQIRDDCEVAPGGSGQFGRPRFPSKEKLDKRHVRLDGLTCSRESLDDPFTGQLLGDSQLAAGAGGRSQEGFGGVELPRSKLGAALMADRGQGA